MPLVQIHVLRSAGRDPAALRLLADTVQDVLLSHFNAPPRDRYQIITQHDPGELICEDTGLPDLPRSDKLVMIQIFQQGRTKELKEKTYSKLMEMLGKNCGLGESMLKFEVVCAANTRNTGPGDLIVTMMENTPEDWSFGAGRAQFLTGEL